MAASIENISFFCIPKPGKVDSKVPFGKERPRIKYNGQKGNTCFYYAFQLLRDERKIGKQPTPEVLEVRKIELAISKHRKRMTNIHSFDLCRCSDISDFVNKLLGTTCVKSDVNETLTSQISKASKRTRRLVNQALESFMEQSEYDDFATYCKQLHLGTDTYWLALIGVHEKLFKDLNIPLEEVHTSIPLYLKATWDELDIALKHAFAMKYTYHATCVAYGAKYSSWRPDEPIDKLIEQLKLHGPHLISGEFGRIQYEAPPFQSKFTIQGRSLFGWKPGSKRRDDGLDHAVVLVGATKQNSKETIFYIDPEDSSVDAKTQQIYMMSMERLRSSIRTFGSWSLNQFLKAFEDLSFDKEHERITSWAMHF